MAISFILVQTSLKMASGHALNDEDRKPWLHALNDAAFAMQRTNKSVINRLFRIKKTVSRYVKRR